jgi:hypothetical protein
MKYFATAVIVVTGVQMVVVLAIFVGLLLTH